MKHLTKATLLLLICLFLSSGVAAAGLSASQGEYYYDSTPLSSMPHTFEATIIIPSDFDGATRGGVIYGNYDSSNSCVSFEIYSYGSPRLYVYNASTGQTVSVIFDKINVYNGAPTHIAIVNDTSTSSLMCYINGQLKQTVSSATPENITFSTGMVLGGDKRNGNGMFFKGKILNLACFDDVRISDEIASDYSDFSKDSEGLVCYYDVSELTDTSEPSKINDLSGNGRDLVRYAPFLEEVEIPSDFSYSFAVVGDTQMINYYYPQYMTRIYDWIADNAEKNKLKFVFGLGDITDANTNAEWALAKAVIQKLDGIVPYSLVRGNHDSAEKFKSFLPYSEFETMLSGSYDGSTLNTYQFLTVNGIKYLIFTLDYGASDSVLNWAGGIIEKNKDCNVIITTHAYLFRDGTTLDEGDVCPPSLSGGYNDGDDMWEKLIKKHENIVLVLSGHDPSDYIVLAQDKGENGNVVSQLLIDPQGTDVALGGCGLVAMLYFSEDGSKVDVRYYSTVTNKYYLIDNQFSFELNVIKPETPYPSVPTAEIRGISFNVDLTADSYDGNIIAALYNGIGKLVTAKIYEASDSIPVSFPASSSGNKIKVFWWNGIDTLIPVCAEKQLEFSE